MRLSVIGQRWSGKPVVCLFRCVVSIVQYLLPIMSDSGRGLLPVSRVDESSGTGLLYLTESAERFNRNRFQSVRFSQLWFYDLTSAAKIN